nr:DsbA family oxidoreductase [Actinocatenispora thailandica]
MRIEIWADLVCGWAYVAKRRIERALADWPGPPPELHWRPYRIDPTAPSRPVRLAEALQDPQVDAALSSCGAGGDEVPAAARMRAAAAAADEGIGPRFGAAWRVDPTGAHRLAALAYRQGGAALQDRVVESLLHAHFVAGEPISDPAVLARIAADAGLPADVLAGDDGTDEVADALLVGKARGIVASPTIVVGRSALRGAQPPEAILDLLRGATDSGPKTRTAPSSGTGGPSRCSPPATRWVRRGCSRRCSPSIANRPCWSSPAGRTSPPRSWAGPRPCCASWSPRARTMRTGGCCSAAPCSGRARPTTPRASCGWPPRWTPATATPRAAGCPDRFAGAPVRSVSACRRDAQRRAAAQPPTRSTGATVEDGGPRRSRRSGSA